MFFVIQGYECLFLHLIIKKELDFSSSLLNLSVESNNRKQHIVYCLTTLTNGRAVYWLDELCHVMSFVLCVLKYNHFLSKNSLSGITVISYLPTCIVVFSS